MKKTLVLTSLLLVGLAGCATQPKTVLRRGKIIKSDTPTEQAAPPAKAAPVVSTPVAPVVVKPVAPAPVVPPPPPPVVVAKPTPPPAPIVVAPVVKPAAPVPAAPTADKPVVATRAGAVVQVAWVLPESDVGFKAVEIMRNDRDQAQGRGRVRAVRASVSNIEDTVPDADANYWYWIKLTRNDGQVQNLGPVAALKN
jgi:hypothetical protein